MIEISKAHKIHMVGIKGWGMTALAQLLLQSGHEVAGSDVSDEFLTDRVLKTLGIEVATFSPDNVTSNIDLIIYSTAYPLTHPELARAQELGIPMMAYPEVVAQLFNNTFGIAVCGSHGKTTTTALLGTTMKKIGLDPTVLVGSKVTEFGANAVAGASEYFVLEADEYQNKIAQYLPKIALMINVDYDHPDYFKTRESYDQVFEDFSKKVLESGAKLVVCSDDEGVRRVTSLLPKENLITYGFEEGAMIRITDYRIKDGFVAVTLKTASKETTLMSPLVGRHNALNLAGVYSVLQLLGISDDEKINESVQTFQGTARRFERKGIAVDHTLIIDDYAHHPTEIRVTLQAARELFPDKKIVCVFGPHTFSRTEVLLDEFAHSFGDVDEVIIPEIFASAREAIGNVSSRDLVNKVNQLGGNAIYAVSNEEVVEYLMPRLSEIDVLITMGAGETWRIGEALL